MNATRLPIVSDKRSVEGTRAPKAPMSIIGHPPMILSGLGLAWVLILGIPTASSAQVGSISCAVVRGSLELRWDSRVGVQYTLQSSTNLTQWTDVSSATNGTGGPIILTLEPPSAPQFFFRFRSTTGAPTYPQTLTECEASGSGTWICGTWTLHGSQYLADWGNGAKAVINIVSWDDSGVVLVRDDTEGASAGLSAHYEGRLNGNGIENGVVTWTLEGRTWGGVWYANW